MKVEVWTVEKLNVLRERVAALGVQGAANMDRFQCVAKLAESEAAVEALRQECAKQGLATGGSRPELEIRLTEKQAGVSARDRLVYQVTACLLIGMAFVGLAISTPHIAAALARLMGMGPSMAALLAVTIDGGLIALKMMDNLGGKFHLGSARWGGKAALVVCLAFSAALNASEFLTHSTGLFSGTLAVSGAVFISGFVFVTSFYGSNMLLKCEPKTEADAVSKMTAAAILCQAAAEVDRLERLAATARK